MRLEKEYHKKEILSRINDIFMKLIIPHSFNINPELSLSKIVDKTMILSSRDYIKCTLAA